MEWRSEFSVSLEVGPFFGLGRVGGALFWPFSACAVIAPLFLRGKGSIWAKHPLDFRLCGLRLRALKISLDLGVRGMMFVVLSIIDL